MRISRTALSHLLHVEAYETYPAGATFGTAYSIIPSRSPIAPGRIDPETPGRFSLRLAIYPPPQVLQIVGRPLSSRPCRPLCRRHCKWQGPFAPRALLRFIATTGPSDSLSSLADFPVSPVIRPTLLRRFLAGTRRVSPVAQHVLVTVRRGGDAASVRFRHPTLRANDHETSEVRRV